MIIRVDKAVGAAPMVVLASLYGGMSQQVTMAGQNAAPELKQSIAIGELDGNMKGQRGIFT